MANGSLRQKSGAFFTRGGSSWSVGGGQRKAGFSTWWKRQCRIDSASPEKSCLVSESVFQHLLCPIHSLDLETGVWPRVDLGHDDLQSTFVTRTLLTLRDAFAADRDTGQSVSRLDRSGGGTHDPGARALRVELCLALVTSLLVRVTQVHGHAPAMLHFLDFLDSEWGVEPRAFELHDDRGDTLGFAEGAGLEGVQIGRAHV